MVCFILSYSKPRTKQMYPFSLLTHYLSLPISERFFLVLSFPFITGAFATFIVQEKSSKAKHLQTVAGVKPFSYWLSSYIWDVCNYQFPLWITICLMFAFDIEPLTTSDNDRNISTILLLFFFGPAAAGFTYM